MTNCPNCGAPITNDIRAYCGTVFIDPKEYEDLKNELQNAKFRASLEAQNEVRGLVGFGEVGRSTWSALMN